MTFKEECLKLYEDIAKRNEAERKKRVEESRRRERQSIVKEFERNFERPFKEEYLIEEEQKYGYCKYIIVLDEIRILVSYQGGNNYWGKYYLLISCHKCGRETTYKNNLNSSYLHNIGRILNEPSSAAPYNRVCNDCKEKEAEKSRELRETNYQKRAKERNDDIIKKMADAIANILKEGGYRDILMEEEYYEG